MDLTSRARNRGDEVALMRVPPQNLEAERFILGGILLDNEAFHQVIEILQPGDFYRESHRKIFEAMVRLYERTEPLDLITLTNFFQGKEEVEKVGGAAYLSSLVDDVSTAPGGHESSGDGGIIETV